MNGLFSLQDKIILITGASRGLGWAMAQAMALVHVQAYQMMSPLKTKLTTIKKLSYHPSYGKPKRLNTTARTATTMLAQRIAGYGAVNDRTTMMMGTNMTTAAPSHIACVAS